MSNSVKAQDTRRGHHERTYTAHGVVAIRLLEVVHDRADERLDHLRLEKLTAVLRSGLDELLPRALYDQREM